MMQEVSELKPKPVAPTPPKPPGLLRRLRDLDIYPKIEESYRVQTSGGAVLSIIGWVLIAILALAEVHLDAMDVAGDNQLNVEHEMVKQRLTAGGRRIGKAGVEIIGEGPIEVQDHPPNYCGDCFGASSEDIKCCNTCNELIQAYQRKQWSVSEILRNSTQCLHDRAKHFANLGTRSY
ncbi:hypothetical protein B484DRAFT_211831 [Ochromonadaceae sp. CCMP2298]|nr:hypothetical protein B484DRAFT_211831 [Ochromonadaceae sp. CCMP2298]